MAKPGVVPGWGREPSRNAKIPITLLPLFSPWNGTPERRGRGGRNPTASPKAEQCAPAQGEALPM